MKRMISVLAVGIALILAASASVKAQPSFPLLDNAEDADVSGALWAFDPEDSPWEVSARGGHSGDQVWLIQPDPTWRYLTLAEAIDLSGASNPAVQFWARIPEGDVQFNVEVSNDGGTSWEVLRSAIWTTTAAVRTEWVRMHWSLENYRQPNVVIRIGAWDNEDRTNTFMIDDILIDNAPDIGVIRLMEPTNNGLRLSWNESTADDFGLYWIVLDTNGNGANSDRTSESSVSSRRERRIFEVTSQSTTDTVLTDLVFTNTQYFARIYEQDTQELWNQGSERIANQTTIRTTPEIAPFTQDFEGTFEWAADLPWQVTEVASGETGHTASRAWEDSPVGSGLANYASSTDRWLVTEVDFSGVARPLLRFRHKHVFEGGIDFGYVSWSLDNVTWTDLALFSGVEGLWKTEEFDIGFLGRQPQAFLRFRLTSNGSTQRDGWHLDDVEVVENPQTELFPFNDDVEDEIQSQQDWVGGRWNPQVSTAHSGDQVWAIRPDQVWQYLTLTGPIDLSGAANPALSFWARIPEGDVQFNVEVSNDGGTSWEVLRSAIWTSTAAVRAEWVRLVWTLENYRQPNVVIRIGAWDSEYRNNAFMIDDILIDNAPDIGVIRLTEPTNNGLRLSWNESTADDFGLYWIVLDTNGSLASSDRTTESSVSDRRERRVFEVNSQSTTDTVLTDLVFINTQYFAKIYEQDAQGLWNQGSERSEGQTTIRTTPEIAPFTQNFEGTFEWAADLPWQVTEAASGETGHTASRAWEDSPVGSGLANYASSADRWLVTEVNFSGVARPLLRFSHKHVFEGGIDFGYVSWSRDNVNWTDLALFSGVEGLWKTEEFDIGFLGRQPQAFLRFRLTSNGSTQRDGWHLDDVEVVENPQTELFPFNDDVEDEIQSQQDWVGGRWNPQVSTAHSGDQVWAIRPDQVWQYLTLAGPIDLSGAANPALSFWARIPEGDVQFNVQVSNDGGTSWEVLRSNIWTSTAAVRAEWVRLVWTLENYRQPNVVIRIGAWDSEYRNNTFTIDDISIDFPPTITGDISGDGEISALDASVLLQYIVGLTPLGSSGLAAADVTGNGTISPLDATFILQFAVGLITQFPADTSGKLVAGWGALEWAEPWRGSAADQVVVPLVLSSDARNVRAVQYRAQLDADLVEVEHVLANLPADWQMAYNFEADELRVVMAGITPVEPGELAQLKLRLRQPEVPLALSGAAFINENAPTRLAEIAVGPLPAIYSLAQNYPNPFNPTTQIQYRLPEAGEVHLTIHNLVGQKVRTLVEHMQPAGMHTVEWDGRDDEGRQAESGVYLYRIQSSGFVQTRKMVLVQ